MCFVVRNFTVTGCHNMIVDIASCDLLVPRLEVRAARRQNLKLAWEDAWNHGRIKLSVKWLSHRSVRP